MSYILEALKKAEAERQLGATPTLHAPVLEGAAPRASVLRKPLVAAVGALAAAIAVLAAVLWQRAPAVAPPGPVAPATVAAASTPARPVAAPAAGPAVAPVAPVAPSIVTPAAPAAAATPVPPPPTVLAAAPPVAAPAPAVKAEPPAATAKPAEEPAQALADLPEPIRRAIPPFSMDGYMYSSNPADRLILIDKVLRREGDEVAPGLVLEKLLPKGAVFSFRGYRYRVAF
ncbi:general secretion pathway protein GspB [Pseudoduganella armeniaca]|uniref:Type II secretion system protein GspB C-terminal domain-containing protein n=1 Tax=Pseudoduganella armeniaca TaxID=2072590 RepID=A0A2R4C8H2_9BURK|nr:general secretion pathway protein GspB [Pseudoduganella armeniaca]AVR95860.1 hypothetical protein C9I28_09055 [Pseudoduganella armeniaca]